MPRFTLFLLLAAAVACGGGDGEDVDTVVGADGPEGLAQGVLPLPPGIGPDVVTPLAAPAAERDALPVVDADHLAGFGEDLVRVYVLGVGDDYADPAFLGLVLSCSGDLVEATVTHGLFPPAGGAPVRTVVEAPDADGESAVFGPSRSLSAGATGPHETLLADPVDVERLVRVAFVSGAVVSNGYRSFRNALPADRTAAAAAEILACPAFLS